MAHHMAMIGTSHQGMDEVRSSCVTAHTEFQEKINVVRLKALIAEDVLFRR